MSKLGWTQLSLSGPRALGPRRGLDASNKSGSVNSSFTELGIVRVFPIRAYVLMVHHSYVSTCHSKIVRRFQSGCEYLG